MASKYPSNASVTIDGMKVNTFSALTGISALTDGSGNALHGINGLHSGVFR
jgi:hypothetical protein